jgi:hypothetical protein
MTIPKQESRENRLQAVHCPSDFMNLFKECCFSENVV